MIKNTIGSYVTIKQNIAQQRQRLASLKKEEAKLVQEIRQFLNETNEIGVRIDDTMSILIKTNNKKITLSSKKYKTKVISLLESRGIFDPKLADEIIMAKTEETVKEQKLTMAKNENRRQKMIAL